MPLDIPGVIDRMIENRDFENLLNGVSAQFGTRARTYLGATLLPERQVPDNMYEEAGIRYRSIVANDGTRYSPVQLKSGILVGSFMVSLGYQDIGSHFTARDYDAFLRLLTVAASFGDNPSMTAMIGLIRWMDTQINIPLREKIEKQRWEALLKAQIVRQGDNGYKETISLSNPTSHRIASGDWTNNSYDPYDDILERVEFLKNKGYTVNRIVTDTTSFNKYRNNTKVRQRLGTLSILSNTVVGLAGRATIGQINDLLSQDGIPPFEIYDLQYQTDTGSEYFFERGNMLFASTTGRDETIILGPDQAPVVLEDTLGYVGVGTPVGQTAPGRVAILRPELRSKPPRIEAEGWQATLPVVAEPEALAVLTNI